MMRQSCGHVEMACAGSEDLLDGLLLALRERPFSVVLSLRLNPLPPAGLTSYALGLVGTVPLSSYIAACALGTAPNVLAYVFVGALLTTLEALRRGEVHLTPQGTALGGVSFAISIALCVWLWPCEISNRPV